MTLRLRLVALAAAVVTGATGCTSKLVQSRIEKGVAEKLPQMIGPADSYKVHVEGSAGRLMRGRIPRLEIVGRGVKPGGQYYLDELHIIMTGVVANPDTRSVESVESTRISAVLTEASLNRYLSQNRHGLKELRVDLREGEMMVHTRPSISRFSTSVNLTGKLRIDSDTKLRFVVNRMTFAGLKTPGFVADFVENRINPVLDIAQFKFPAKLESVTVGGDKVQVYGTADLSKGIPNAEGGVGKSKAEPQRTQRGS